MAAEYWMELATYLADSDYTREVLASSGLELLSTGPSAAYTTYWRVRDPDAPAELNDKTVIVTFDMRLIDANACPPRYSYRVTGRKDRNAA